MTEQERKAKQARLDATAARSREFVDKHEKLVDKSGVEYWTLWDALKGLFKRTGKATDYEAQHGIIDKFLENPDSLKDELNL